MASTSYSDQKKPRKRAHYLRHSQRCTIIQRIVAGEQQAALAREYKVTRAAISHIYKNREEILAREFEDESEEEGEEEEDLVEENSTVSSAVTEICDHVILTLMTTLRDARADSSTFNRAADRLITILLEESVAMLGTRVVERVGAAGEPYTGLELQYEFCGVTMNAEALPFTFLLTDLEPNSTAGSIDIEEQFDGFGNPVRWHIRHIDVPADITGFKILLFTFSCGDTGAECKAIETLQTLGINEQDIAIVAIQCSSRGIAMITNHYPQIRIVTAVIDDQVRASQYEVFPGLGAYIAHANALRASSWNEEEEKGMH